MHRSRCFCYFLNASWKSCSMWVLSTACDSASVVFKWQYIQSGKQRKVTRDEVRQVGRVGDDRHIGFGKNSLLKRRWKMMHWHDSTTSFCCQSSRRSPHTFHAIIVKHHSSVHDWQGQILSEQSPWMNMVLTLLFSCLAIFSPCEFGLLHSNTCVQVMLSLLMLV